MADSVDDSVQTARHHFRAGRFAEAEGLYRQVLAQQPDQPEALHGLGMVAAHGGKFGDASDLIQRALALRPNWVEAYRNLGNVLHAMGRPQDAITIFRQAIHLNPRLAMTHCDLGNALGEVQKYDEAIACYRHAIALRPDIPGAYCNMGQAMRKLKNFEPAIELFQKAISLQPLYPEAYNNLANALMDVGRREEAIAAYRRAIALQPDLTIAHYNLGVALEAAHQPEQAVDAYRAALRLQPGFADAHCSLGSALTKCGQFEEALAACHRAIEIDPTNARPYNNMTVALRDTGRHGQAIDSARRAMEIDPHDYSAHSNLIFTLHYHPDMDSQTIADEHRKWGIQHALPLLDPNFRFPNDRTPNRRLRVGYVSPDFKDHSVSRFLIPLFEHHDRDAVEFFCYSNVDRPDDYTALMKRLCACWREIAAVSDQEAAHLVRSDAIDILVDLSGHTQGNRLALFSRRPAPIQVTYLGYPNTTGIKAIDYRLTDVLADPPGTTESFNVETLWRLPTSAWCFLAPTHSPKIQSRSGGPITFGCFNGFAKINLNMIAIWADLLKRVPGSRLLLKSIGAGSFSVRQRLISQFADLGVSSERIEMRGWISDPLAHLQAYADIDIALDTYPYHGTTTTCEALYMGVPVVTLAGLTHVSRVGVSLITTVGLPQLIASTPDEYVSIASALASDPSRLAAIRSTLRTQIMSSRLVDGLAFASQVEAAYREMWRNWISATLSP